jgi:hypothetical protein
MRYEGYQPTALGAKAMIRHVDDFRTVHNLASLDQLTEALGRIGPRRSEGRASGGASFPLAASA